MATSSSYYSSSIFSSLNRGPCIYDCATTFDGTAEKKVVNMKLLTIDCLSENICILEIMGPMLLSLVRQGSIKHMFLVRVNTNYLTYAGDNHASVLVASSSPSIFEFYYLSRLFSYLIFNHKTQDT